MWFRKKKPRKTLEEIAEECRVYGHVSTGWDGYWDQCGRCGRRFIEKWVDF